MIFKLTLQDFKLGHYIIEADHNMNLGVEPVSAFQDNLHPKTCLSLDKEEHENWWGVEVGRYLEQISKMKITHTLTLFLL